mmetsp:Transcript_39279/g.72510  ORF Transcript_39279/g.72510 Transcript_39279/m.72510 type:complete len:204 (+) Transcript_39279:172-783(+)
MFFDGRKSIQVSITIIQVVMAIAVVCRAIISISPVITGIVRIIPRSVVRRGSTPFAYISTWPQVFVLVVSRPRYLFLARFSLSATLLCFVKLLHYCGHDLLLLLRNACQLAFPTFNFDLLFLSLDLIVPHSVRLDALAYFIEQPSNLSHVPLNFAYLPFGLPNSFNVRKLKLIGFRSPVRVVFAVMALENSLDLRFAVLHFTK